MAYTAAHWPMHAPEKAIAKYKGKYDQGYGYYRQQHFERLKQMGLIHKDWDLSPQAGDWEKVENKEWEARCMEVYAAMVDIMDQGIGRVVAAVEEAGRPRQHADPLPPGQRRLCGDRWAAARRSTRNGSAP